RRINPSERPRILKGNLFFISIEFRMMRIHCLKRECSRNIAEFNYRRLTIRQIYSMIASKQRLAACLSTNSKTKENLADEGKNRVEDHVGDQNCTDEDTGR